MKFSKNLSERNLETVIELKIINNKCNNIFFNILREIEECDYRLFSRYCRLLFPSLLFYGVSMSPSGEISFVNDKIIKEVDITPNNS